MSPGVFIHAIATGVPALTVSQADAESFMLRHLALSPEERAFLRRVYAGSGIERRHTVVDDFARETAEFTFFGRTGALEPQPSTAERNARYAAFANVLAAQTVSRLLERVRVPARGITHLVTASCTGFAAPGFDCHLVSALGLDPAVQRFHLGFMGCFAAFPALRLADHICRSSPDARVAIVNLELCTLHFTTATDPSTIVTQCLFSDGAAAMLVSAGRGDSERPLYALRHFASRILPASAGDMTWIVGDHGFEMGLTAAVPRLIEQHVRSVLEDQCRAAGMTPGDVRHWAMHPGGRAILDKAADALGLSRERFAASYRMLREHGNMSSATVGFVLDEVARDSAPGPVFSAAFGPGLTVESALLERL